MLTDPRDSLLSSYDYELPEACIAQRPIEPRHAARLLMVEPGAGCRDRQVWDPVSYTHLRAHETVLDLVCRLLLEKKK